MQKEVSILCVEDVPADVARLNHALREAGMSFRSKRVETQEAFLHELEHNPPDVILSDHGLPSFDGFMALTLAQNKCPDVPFIFVTGRLGEQIAIESLRNGAADCVLKSNLAKLAPTIQRALREAGERAVLKRQWAQLSENEERYRRMVEFCPDAFLVQCDGTVVYANRAAAHLLGTDDACQLVGKPFREFIHPQSLESLETRFNQLTEEGSILFWRKIEKGTAGERSGSPGEIAFTEEKLIQVDGSPLEVEVAATPFMFQRSPAIQIIVHDITGRKSAEAARRENEECYRILVEDVQEYAIYMLDASGCVASWNAGAERTRGYRADEVLGKPFAMFFTPEDKQHGLPEQLIEKAKVEGRSVNEGWRVRKDGSQYWSRGVLRVLRDENGKLLGFSKIAHDVTCQKEAGEIRRQFAG